MTEKVKFSIVIIMACLLSSFVLNTHAANAEVVGHSDSSISANPAAVNISTGTGEAQRAIEKQLGVEFPQGVRVGGLWIGDINQLFSGGIPHADRTTVNSLFILSLSIDTEKFNGWKGGLFGVEVMQLNAQDTNGQAGSVEGYNCIPGPPPLNRFELYQLWYRQTFFDEKLIIRIGKTVPTYDFDNVIKPVVLSAGNPTIPAVTGLIYTPIYIDPSMFQVMPGYYNSAYGITMSLAPIKTWYLSYGIYDGNLARNLQTGLHGPTFNGSYFQIGETGLTWLLGKNKLPGNIGTGVWYQHGPVLGAVTTTEDNAAGFYIFGAQRVWYKHPGWDNSGISIFYQFGVNNSNAILVKKYIGTGFTAFNLVPHRPDDSMGFGAALSWLNPTRFRRTTELILQGYYQAKMINGFYLEPALSYIPTPGARPHLHPVWAGTLRAIILF